MSLLLLNDLFAGKLMSVVISGKKVLLRPISQQYAEDIFTEFTGDITRYMIPSPPGDIEQVRKYIHFSLENIKADDELVLVITRADNGEFLGVCALHGRLTTDTPELGIWIKKQVQGNGYGTDAIRALMAWTRENVTFSYLRYPVDKNNIASRSLAESLNGEIIRNCLVTTRTGKVLEEVVYKINSDTALQ